MLTDFAATGVFGTAIGVAVFWIIVDRRALRDAQRDGGEGHRWTRLPIGIPIWLAVTAAFAASGLIQREPRLMMAAMLPAFGGAAFLALSTLGRRIAMSTTWTLLIGYQCFRIMLELVLHQLYTDGRLPVQVTYYGLNFDIVSGVLAVPLAIWAAFGKPPRTLLIGWNTIAFVLLGIIGAVATLSMPTPFRQFTGEPSTILLSTFPFIWVPTFLAPSALAGHILVYRKLMMDDCCRRQAMPDQ